MKKKTKPLGKTEPIYGIWLTSKHDGECWLVDSTGNIIQSDFLGLMKAQMKLLESFGAVGKIMIIGEDGNPVEIEE